MVGGKMPKISFSRNKITMLNMKLRTSVMPSPLNKKSTLEVSQKL